MACPNLEQLEQLAGGGISAAERTSVQAHIDSCDSCRTRFDEVRGNLELGRRVAKQPPVETLDAAAPGGGAPVTQMAGTAEPLRAAVEFPGYELKREISRGGQGIVYQAIQLSTNRKVAIKVLREQHFADASDKARFEREIQILGQLKHPNIVTIYDSGSVAGNAFCVMDYISGKPLDEHLKPRSDAATKPRSGKSKRGRDSRIEEIAALFAPVCEAVHAAHLRGITHRDLKPSNIRVDDNGRPHVLDFGLAKITGMEDVKTPAMTLTGQFLGSLPWSSPEQAEGNPGKIDIRTDVYSLGVMLYQLLTGKFPYEVIGPMRDVLDRIARSEPVRPSTITKQIDDELETIVLKCLSKERERRYQSAGELARDLRCYLAGEPIEAKRDSAFYALKKTLRRYRAFATAAGAVLLVSTIASVVSTSLWRRAASAELRERLERQNAVVDKERAQAAEQQALSAKLEIEKAAESLRRRSYVSAIALAGRLYDEGNARRLNPLLEACPADLRDWEWRRLWSLSHRSTSMLPTMPSGASIFALSSSGRRVALLEPGSGGTDARSLRVVNVETGESVATGTLTVGNWLAFTPDDLALIVALRDEISVMRIRSDGILEKTRGWPIARNSSLALSPDGERVAQFDGKRLRIWRIATGEQLQELADLGSRRALPVFSADGRRAALVTGSGLELLDLDSATWLNALPARSSESIPACECAVFSADGRMLVSGGFRGDLTLWDTATREQRWERPAHVGVIWAVQFSADETQIFTGGNDGAVRAWDTTSGEPRGTLLGHVLPVRSLALVRDGAALISISSESCRKWSLPLHADVTTYTASANERRGTLIGMSDDGGRIALAESNTISIRDTRTLATIRTLTRLDGSQFRVETAHFTADGARVLLVGELIDPRPHVRDIAMLNTTFELWDVAGERLSSFRGEHSVSLGSLVLDPQGHRAAFAWSALGPTGYELEMLDLGNGVFRATQLELQPGSIRSLVFSPDGHQVINVLTQPQQIVIGDAATGEVVQRLDDSQVEMRLASCVAISADGQRMIYGDTRGQLHLWDLVAGRRVREWSTHVGRLCAVAFGPRGRRVASVGDDQTVRIWDPDTAEELLTLKGAPERATKIVFNENSVVAMNDRGVATWVAEEIQESQPASAPSPTSRPAR